MENISATEATNHDMLDFLVVRNTCLSTTTEKQHATIKSLWEEINTL